MEIDSARQFFAQHHRCVLMTRRADDSIQASPVVAGVDTEGRVIISSRETAYKTKNLRRDPRAAVIGLTDDFFGEWVQIEGTAEVIGLPKAMDLLVDYYRRLSGEHSNWVSYRRAMEEEQRVIIRISITRAGPDVSG